MIFRPDADAFAPRRPLLLAAAAMVALALSGCASAPAQHNAQVTVGPAPAATPAGDSLLPPLPVLAAPDPAAGEPRRIQQLDVVNQDLRSVVRGLAESYGLDYSIHPSVGGPVSTRLRDVTLQQALDALVTARGFEYQIQDNVLRVAPSRMQTRIFSLDYVSLSRTGTGTTTIQRRLGNSGGGFGGLAGGGGAGALNTGGYGGLAGGGVDVIQSVTVADLWEELRVALEGLIFTTAAGGADGASAAGPVAGFTARAPGPYSRVGEDGRRLIINPLAGVVVVSAPEEKLQEIAAFLATVEGSVQRQVLIEAKIVEVSLNRRFQFGIDWSVVQRVGNVRLRFGAGQGGTELALEGPDGDASGAVNVVLRALEQQGHVNVLSSPRVSVLNNQRAVFNVTTDQVFFSVSRQPILGPTGGTIGFNTEIQPQQVAVGITLDVLAQIATDQTITMNVRPIITDVVAEKRVDLPDGTQATAPVIDRRETDTMARVRNGETIIIGGLMQSRSSRESGGVPGLRSIPVLGRLFGGGSRVDEKRELVIFITPRIIAAQPPVGS